MPLWSERTSAALWAQLSPISPKQSILQLHAYTKTQKCALRNLHPSEVDEMMSMHHFTAWGCKKC